MNKGMEKGEDLVGVGLNKVRNKVGLDFDVFYGWVQECGFILQVMVVFGDLGNDLV